MMVNWANLGESFLEMRQDKWGGSWGSRWRVAKEVTAEAETSGRKGVPWIPAGYLSLT